MPNDIAIHPKLRPPVDPEFLPAALWNREFRAAVAAAGGGEKLAFALERPDGSVSVYHTAVLPHSGFAVALNQRYVERLVKFLLWQRGGYRVTIAGDSAIAEHIRAVYSPAGARAFDFDFMGDRVYGHPMEILGARYADAPETKETGLPLGRHLDGCRIGFDLGAATARPPR